MDYVDYKELGFLYSSQSTEYTLYTEIMDESEESYMQSICLWQSPPLANGQHML